MDEREGMPCVSNARLIHGDQEILLERLILDHCPSDSGEIEIFASVYIRAKVLGLSPGQSDLKVSLQWEGKPYEIAEATVFDVDHNLSGETAVQLTGKLKPVSQEETTDASTS